MTRFDVVVKICWDTFSSFLILIVAIQEPLKVKWFKHVPPHGSQSPSAFSGLEGAGGINSRPFEYCTNCTTQVHGYFGYFGYLSCGRRCNFARQWSRGFADCQPLQAAKWITADFNALSRSCETNLWQPHRLSSQWQALCRSGTSWEGHEN